MTTVSATDLKNRIGETLNDVEFRGERVILRRKGRPVGAIIPMEDLALLEKIEDELDAREIERVLADGSAEWLTLEEAERELDL